MAGTLWKEHVIWWHVYPLGFTGAPASAPADGAPVRHRLRRLEAWLDYAVELGCSGLLLGPIFAAGTHGYDTVDHFRIDPRLGDDADFDHLVGQATGRGLRIVLDGVFNHVGRGFPVFVRALADGPGSASARWFRPLPGPAEQGPTEQRPAEQGPAGLGKAQPGSAPGGAVSYATFEGHRQLVELNHDEPAVAGHVTAVMKHWLGRGAAGWRLDAAYAVPVSFWGQVLPAVKQEYPDAWFTAEVIHGDYARFAAGSGADSVTQYELWKAIWSSLNDGNLFELAHALGRHDAMLDSFAPLTFAGNHDVTRLASQLTDGRHLGHALAVLLSVGGTPSIYYGDEQGFRGVKENRSGGDDAIRPAFPDGPAGLPAGGWPIYRLHQRLIGMRRRHPWLVRARTTVEHLANRTAALRSAAPGGESEIITLLNTGDDPHRFPLAEPGEHTVAATPDPGQPPAEPGLVPGHSWIVLSRRPSR